MFLLLAMPRIAPDAVFEKAKATNIPLLPAGWLTNLGSIAPDFSQHAEAEPGGFRSREPGVVFL